MKAIVWHGVGDMRLDQVPDPLVQDPHDAVVEVTASAICGAIEVHERFDRREEGRVETVLDPAAA